MRMSAPEEPRPQPSGSPESDWERRRRLAAVFGDSLPDTTSDERDPEPGRDRQAGTRRGRRQGLARGPRSPRTTAATERPHPALTGHLEALATC